MAEISEAEAIIDRVRRGDDLRPDVAILVRELLALRAQRAGGGEPVAWRYRYAPNDGRLPGQWHYVESLARANQGPDVRLQALYAHPPVPAPVAPSGEVCALCCDPPKGEECSGCEGCGRWRAAPDAPIIHCGKCNGSGRRDLGRGPVPPLVVSTGCAEPCGHCGQDRAHPAPAPVARKKLDARLEAAYDKVDGLIQSGAYVDGGPEWQTALGELRAVQQELADEFSQQRGAYAPAPVARVDLLRALRDLVAEHADYHESVAGTVPDKITSSGFLGRARGVLAAIEQAGGLDAVLGLAPPPAKDGGEDADDALASDGLWSPGDND